MRTVNKETLKCDCCTGEFVLDYDEMSESDIKANKASLIEIKIDNNSMFGKNLNFHVCEKCLKKWLKEFKIRPDVDNPCPRCGEELRFDLKDRGFCPNCEYREKESLDEDN